MKSATGLVLSGVFPVLMVACGPMFGDGLGGSGTGGIADASDGGAWTGSEGTGTQLDSSSTWTGGQGSSGTTGAHDTSTSPTHGETSQNTDTREDSTESDPSSDATTEASTDEGELGEGSSGDEGGDEDPNCHIDPLPGLQVVEAEVEARGRCVGISLGAMIATTITAFPELEGIERIRDPEKSQVDGDFVHAFIESNGAWKLVFESGEQGCEYGCAFEAWHYIATDDFCRPYKVGVFRGDWQADRGCVEVEGKPRWGVPEHHDPLLVCGADKDPAFVAGEYLVAATGHVQACGEDESQVWSGDVRLRVGQSPDELEMAGLEIAGLEHPRLVGRTFAASVRRRRVEASLWESDAGHWELAFSYDIDHCIRGGIWLEEYRSDGDCWGYIDLDFVRPPRRVD